MKCADQLSPDLTIGVDDLQPHLMGHPFARWLHQHRSFEGDCRTVHKEDLKALCVEYLSAHKHENVVSREVYAFFGRIAHDYLLPACTGNSDPVVEKEWSLESGGIGFLSKRALQWSLFEIADIWCHTEGATEYAEFLACLYQHLSTYSTFQKSIQVSSEYSDLEPASEEDDDPKPLKRSQLLRAEPEPKPAPETQQAEPQQVPAPEPQQEPSAPPEVAMSPELTKPPAHATRVRQEVAPRSQAKTIAELLGDDAPAATATATAPAPKLANAPKPAVKLTVETKHPSATPKVRPQTAGARPRLREPGAALGPFNVQSSLDTRNEDYDRGHGYFNSNTWYTRGMDGPLATVHSMKVGPNGQHKGCPSGWAGVKKGDRAALFKELVHNSDKRPLLLRLLNGTPRTLYEG